MSQSLADTVARPVGRWIALEGGDGTGKSKQVEHLSKRLIARGVDVVLTREPGGTAVGQAIRSYLLSDAQSDLSAEAQLILFEGDRAATYHDVIRPAIMRGSWVVSDRGPFGSTVYQGYVQGASLELVDRLTDIATSGRPPELTIVLDVEFETARRRMSVRPEKLTWFDRWGETRSRAVREAYHEVVRKHAGRAVLISAEPEEDAVAAAIWRAVVAKWPHGLLGDTSRELHSEQ